MMCKSYMETYYFKSQFTFPWVIREIPTPCKTTKQKQTKQLPFVLVDHQNEMIITKDITQFISAHKDLKLPAELEASPC